MSTTKFVTKVVIKAPIQAVWDELTKTGEAQKAMFNMVMHTTGLRPGAMIQMRTISNKYVGVVGEVLEIDPPHKFSHTFRFTNYDDPWCKVTYELKEVEGGTEFTLTSEEVPADTKTENQMRSGGDMISNTLKSIVESGKPPLGIRMLHVIFKLTEFMAQASTKVEHWPLLDNDKNQSR